MSAPDEKKKSVLESLGEVSQTLSPTQRAVRIQQECSGVWSSYGISQKSRDFLDSIIQQKRNTLSEKQEKWLKDIEGDAFGGEEPDEDPSYERDRDFQKGTYSKK